MGLIVSSKRYPFIF